LKPYSPLAIVALWLTALAAVAALASGECGRGGLPLLPPSSRHPLGTDPVGRDALCVALRGVVPSLEAGFAALTASLAVVMASMLAGLSRHAGRAVNAATLLAAGLPRIGLLMLLALYTRPPPWLTGFLVGFLSSLNGARSVAARARQIAAAAYVEAAKAMGSSNTRIVARHIAPNAWSAAASYVGMSTAAAVYAEAGLSMLGLGDPSRPDWGLMIRLVAATPGAALTVAGLVQILAALLLTALTATMLQITVERAIPAPDTR
jgi:peptide/nickel transport system permease protein